MIWLNSTEIHNFTEDILITKKCKVIVINCLTGKNITKVI